jgi:hypothetical protein
MANIDYTKKGNEELITLALDHAIPQIRRRANWELVTKRREQLTSQWVAYLTKGTDEQKSLALSIMGYHTPIEAKKDYVDKIGAILRNPKESIHTRVSAAQSLAHFGETAFPYYMDLVKLLADDRPSTQINSYIDQDLGSAINSLCKDPFSKGLVKDKDIFYKAALKLVDHKRAKGRSYGLGMLVDMPFEDLHKVIERIMHVLKNEDPNYESYHSIGGTLGTALEILAKHKIKDGLPYFVKLWKDPGKAGFKVRMICATLPKYGGNAKAELDELEKLNPNYNKGRFAGIWKKMADTIRGDKNPPKLISIEEALKGK